MLDAVCQTCAVTVRTRRAGHAVTLAACSRGSLIGKHRTWLGSSAEVTVRQTITVMTGRTQMKNWISCKQTKEERVPAMDGKLIEFISLY